MSYAQKNKLLNKQLPSYAGFLVLLFALVITVILSGNTFVFVSKATVGSEPKNIQVSNLSDTSFSVSYTTDTSVVGTISYGIDPATPGIALDDRDEQTGHSIEHQVHFITIKNLKPTTRYYYVIDSGSQKAENNGSPYEITTAATLANRQTGQPTVSGTVSLNDGSSPSEGIITVSTDNSAPLAALIGTDGSYNIPLSQLRDTTGSTLAALTSETVLNLQVQTPTEQSTAHVLLNQAEHVPTIVLSQNYDFTLNSAGQSVVSALSASQSAAAFPVLATPAPVSSPEIDSPKEAQAFSDQQPLFDGRALPNTEVDITIQSNNEIDVKLQSDTSGSWQYRPAMTLAPGQHTITIQSVNASGIMQTITNHFTVYASGSKFTEPSVSPVAPTPQPTVIPTPTVLPTATPTPPPSTPTVNTTPAPTSAPVPKTGSSALVIGMVTAAGAIGIGALLIFLSIV